MNSITNKQICIALQPHENKLHFEYRGERHVLPCIDKVHEFFQQKSFDTVKFSQNGMRQYLHNINGKVEVFDSKKALRKVLSLQSGGAWVEEKSSKERYFVDESGWFQTSFRQVSKEEFLQRLDSPSTMQKAMGIGLGILALLPGALEIKERLPSGANAAGMGLLSLQQKSPLLSALGYSLLPVRVEAQAVGTEFQVNNYTTAIQGSSAIAPMTDGGFIVTWQSDGQDGDWWGVFAQRYDANGAIVNFEFQVNNYTTGAQGGPKVAPMNDGGFVIAWTSNGQDGDQGGVFAQRYDATSARIGSEFQVNNFTSSNQNNHAISTLNDGSFIVTWRSDGQDGNSTGIFAQRYNSNGTLFGNEFQVNNYTTSTQQNPAIAPLIDGGFVVVWQSDGQDGEGYGIFAQKYDASGALVGSEFQVNNYSTSNQQDPAVAPLDGGGFVVAWESDGQDGNNFGIFAQRYNDETTRIGTEFQVNNYTADFQHDPSIAPLNDGGFVVTWFSFFQDGDFNGIFAQRYNANGTLFGPEFQVNSYTASNQQYPAIAPLNDGGFVVTWQSWAQDGNQEGIFGQRYDQSGNPIALSNATSMSSASALGSTADTINFADSQLSVASSSTSGNSLLVSSAVSSMRFSSIIAAQTTGLATTPSNQLESSELTSRVQSTSMTNSPSSTGLGVPLLIDVIYGQSYSVIQNGQTIGTFTVTGGTGPYSSNNPNTLNIDIDPNIVLQDGDTFTLFSVPQGEEILWEGITLESECFNAEGELVSNDQTNANDYQVIFQMDSESCTIFARATSFAAIPTLTTGGLI